MGLVAWVITQGAMQQEAVAMKMCTYAPSPHGLNCLECSKKEKKKSICGLFHGVLYEGSSPNLQQLDASAISYF